MSSLVVIGILAWVGYEAMTHDNNPPDLAIEVRQDDVTEAGHRVEFQVLNRSDRTAAAVTVRGEVIDAGTVLESVEVVLDYVPGHSKAGGAFIFITDTTNREIRIQPRGYADP
ncbi:hypothetical protein [Agrobacterium tumefaciens]|uniref:hypothetical protein n=1 Tax=Agrobacterium tumefaciens TaxID=358 RepID=UPI00287E6A17|nr:hypothetical protein [Agrobacterium tumefaciens]MDS7594640.1 hypothetical protein [Agrobacterium tumefaciens]